MITQLIWMASVASLSLSAMVAALRLTWRRLRAAWHRTRTRRTPLPGRATMPSGPVVPLVVVDWLLFALAQCATPEHITALASATARESTWWPVLGLVRARIGELAHTAPEPALAGWCRTVIALDHQAAP